MRLSELDDILDAMTLNDAFIAICVDCLQGECQPSL